MPPTLLQYGKVHHKGHTVPSTFTAIEYVRSIFVKLMHKGGSDGLQDRVFVIKCATGSGKSTVMPVELFRLLRSPEASGDYYGKSVVCTQPRVITARAIPEEQIALADYYKTDMIMNKTLGYRTGEFKSEKQRSMLLYATIGSFKEKLIHSDDKEIMDSIKFIIVDEAHERSLDTDLALMELWYFYNRNKDNASLPFLILTSATIDEHKYARYFGVGPSNVITVDGFTFPIQTHWSQHDSGQLEDAIIKKVLYIHDGPGKDDDPQARDIMVFVSGIGAFENLKPKIHKERKDIIVVFADRKQVQGQTEDYFYVTGKKKLPRGKNRMVVIATNAAETGLTVDTLKYVIDTGWSNVKESYYPYGTTGVILRPIAQSNALQRKGRCGRKAPGEYYPLYTRKTFEAMNVQQFPNIVTEGVENLILELIDLQLRNKVDLEERPEFRIEDLKLLDLPPADALAIALEKCYILGFTSRSTKLPQKTSLNFYYDVEDNIEYGYGLTEKGVIALGFNRTLQSLEAINILLNSFMFKNINTQDVIFLACLLSSDMSIRLNTTIPGFDDVKNVLQCEILETLYKCMWEVKQMTNLLDLDRMTHVYNNTMTKVLEWGLPINNKQSLTELDLSELELVVRDYKRLIAMSYPWNVLIKKEDRWVTRHGIKIKLRLPDSFKDATRVVATEFQLRKNRMDTTYYIRPGQLCNIPQDVDDLLTPKQDYEAINDALFQSPIKNKILYLYWKLLEL